MSDYNNIRDLIEQGFTPLTVQCYLNPHSPFSNKSCCEAVVKRMLKRDDRNINAQEPTNGWTALYCASMRGNAEVVELLIEHKANPSITAHDGTTPLMAAMMHVTTVTTAHRIALALLRLGNNINAVNAKGETALYHAVMKSWEMRDRSSNDVMHITEYYGDAQIVHFLIRRGADVNALVKGSGEMREHSDGRADDTKSVVTHSMGSPILVWACDPKGGACARAVEVLLKAGADINARDAESRTALIRINEDPRVTINVRNEEGRSFETRINENPKAYDNAMKAELLLQYWADEWEQL